MGKVIPFVRRVHQEPSAGFNIFVWMVIGSLCACALVVVGINYALSFLNIGS
jgi:hypothetical protein